MWSLVFLAGFIAVDGIFPPVPSESLVIAMAALTAQGEGHPLWLLIPVAALGAVTGDVLAYAIGTRGVALGTVIDLGMRRFFPPPQPAPPVVPNPRDELNVPSA